MEFDLENANVAMFISFFIYFSKIVLKDLEIACLMEQSPIMAI